MEEKVRKLEKESVLNLKILGPGRRTHGHAHLVKNKDGTKEGIWALSVRAARAKARA